MSSRRESAVLTREDTKIWLNINLPLNRKAPNPFPIIAYQKADRRDADLIYTVQTIAVHGPAAISLFGIPCKGWDLETNHRLKSAPPTPEDLHVMTVRFVDGPRPTYEVDALDSVAVAADRRDADLMLNGVKGLIEVWYCGVGGCYWCGEQFPIAVGPPPLSGWDVE